MEFEEAAIIGRRRRADAASALGRYLKDRATEVCCVRPAKGEPLDARKWEPVGEENQKELHIRRSLAGDNEAFVLLVDAEGSAKACSQRAYPLPIALQLAWAIPLPPYTGADSELMAHRAEEIERKTRQIAQLPEL